jgi:hypothetical protein
MDNGRIPLVFCRKKYSEVCALKKQYHIIGSGHVFLKQVEEVSRVEKWA